MRENKNYRSVPFLLVAKLKITKKKSNKIEKIKIYHYGFISNQNRMEKAEKEKKLKLSIRSVPTRRVMENSKKIAKKLKKLKNTIMASFQAKIGLKRLRKREIKNYRFVSSLPEP